MILENIGHLLYPFNQTQELERIRALIASTSEPITLNGVMEFWGEDHVNNILTQLGVTNQSNITLLLEDSLDIDKINFKNTKTYNHGLVKTAFYSEKYGHNTEIQHDTKRFLFLMGKPYKTHRVGMLYKLYSQGLLSNASWSFYHNDAMDAAIKQHLPKLSDNEYADFITASNKNLDQININLNGDHFYYPGFPIDTTLYARTSFSLISETLFQPINGTRFTTEKLWRTIANNHAFVLIGYRETFDWLEYIGIDTFQYAMKHKKEKFVPELTESNLLDMVCENVQHLLENIEYHSDQLVDSITNNWLVYENRLSTFREHTDDLVEEELLVPYFNKIKY